MTAQKLSLIEEWTGELSPPPQTGLNAAVWMQNQKRKENKDTVSVTSHLESRLIVCMSLPSPSLTAGQHHSFKINLQFLMAPCQVAAIASCFLIRAHCFKICLFRSLEQLHTQGCFEAFLGHLPVISDPVTN